MPVTKGTRPGRQPSASKAQGQGRVCSHAGCQTRLSVYNGSERCWQHTEVVFPNHRGKRLRPERT
jgi:hypothetical protein